MHFPVHGKYAFSDHTPVQNRLVSKGIPQWKAPIQQFIGDKINCSFCIGEKVKVVLC